MFIDRLSNLANNTRLNQKISRRIHLHRSNNCDGHSSYLDSLISLTLLVISTSQRCNRRVHILQLDPSLHDPPCVTPLAHPRHQQLAPVPFPTLLPHAHPPSAQYDVRTLNDVSESTRWRALLICGFVMAGRLASSPARLILTPTLACMSS